MMQRTLFDPGPAPLPDPPQSGTDKSRAAAEEIKPAAGKLRRLVHWFIVQRGPAGATDEEARDALGLHPDTCRARRVELRDLGHVADSGGTRPTRSGRAAIVWIAIDRPFPSGESDRQTR